MKIKDHFLSQEIFEIKETETKEFSRPPLFHPIFQNIMKVKIIFPIIRIPEVLKKNCINFYSPLICSIKKYTFRQN
jgi:hypothetical protein